MASIFNDWNWMYWAAGLMIGFPILVVLLSELSFDLKRRGRSHALTALDLFRNTTLFLIFLTILLRAVIGLPGDHIAVRVVDTALWITLINLALAVFNLAFFSGAEGTWRAQVPKLLIDLCRVFIVLVCAAFVVSQIWSVDLKALLAALGVGSIVIGLALQDTLGNLFSGIAVVSARQFKMGDWIKVGDIEGQVRSVNWRTVSVATPTGDLVIIPNGQIARERLRNFGADRGSNGVLVEFKIPNEQPPQPILDLILSTAATTAGVLEEPKPLARIVAFDDCDILYRAIFHVKDYASLNAVRTEFLANFWYAANRAQISLPPRPAILANPRHEAASAGPHKDATSAARVAGKLASLAIFRRSSASLDTLATHCRTSLFRKGQRLLKTGERSQNLFVVSSGSAAAYFTNGKEAMLVEDFSEGELILFKAFFRNGPSPFDVTASTDLEVVTIPVSQLEVLLAADRALGLEIERLLTLREEAAERATASSIPDLHNGHSDTSRVDILRAMFRG